nr:putative HVA22-like protein G [Ipomoea batatas]
MIGSFLTRGLVMAFGYAYPAYECFKAVELNKPDIQQLRFWCQYWIIVATMTVCERIADTFISWVPMYSEAKLAFYIYLWFPRTKGTTYVYDAFFRPLVLRHEPEIDRNLLELKTWAGDAVFLYWQKAASYGQTRIFDVLQYIASQSTPSPPPAQPRRQGRPPAPPNQKPESATTEPQTEDRPPAAPGESATELEDGAPPKTAVPTASLNAQKTAPTKPLAETSKPPSSSEAQAMQIEPPMHSLADESTKPPTDTVMVEGAARVTRARSRKTQLAASNQ